MIRYITIFVVALLIRLACLYEVSSIPFYDQPAGDAKGYLDWANEIAGGRWIGEKPFYQAPLYPYFLSTLAVIGQLKPISVAAIQCTFGAMCTTLLMLLTTQMLGRRAGIIAGLLWAIYPPAIFFDLIVQKTSLASLLTCLFINTLFQSTQSSRNGWTTVSGFTLALLVLTRENALVWLPAGCALLYFTKPSRPAIPITIFVTSFSLGILPAGIHNMAVGGGLSISTSQAGPNFYIGNRIGATGRYAPLVPGHETPAFERNDATRLAIAAEGKDLSAKEVSRFWLTKSLEEIKAEPIQWLGLVAWKGALLVNAHEVADVESIYVYQTQSLILSALFPFLHLGTLLPLTVAGIVLCRKHLDRWALLTSLWITMAIAVVAFYIMARYRFPIVPLMIPLAAFTLSRIIRDYPRKKWTKLQIIAICAIPAGILCNWPLLDTQRLNAMSYMNLGIAYARQSELHQAEVIFRFANQEHPDSAEISANLGQLLATKGEFDEAIKFYERAIQIQPALPNLYFNAAVAYEVIGRHDLAAQNYERALIEQPEDRDAEQALIRLRRQQ